jgi:hypothetical protein
MMPLDAVTEESEAASDLDRLCQTVSTGLAILSSAEPEQRHFGNGDLKASFLRCKKNMPRRDSISRPVVQQAETIPLNHVARAETKFLWL